MTSRRPMTRSYSGNGRTSSFSEEETSSSNGRSESRNTYLSNVRPENSYSRYSHYRPTRSTLCSVMAQLTEDVQPSFETTLKSKAVSENCNVKFTCVVSGYPAPELKWYKDDMEMDRYCGLPKYEIRRNGKTHTLHIYNCTLDDAAIYQVSASNSKGIVSCSGVLEVGVMNEYKIHQRFFAKLKQKAEKKRSDLEMQAKQEGKENIQKEKPQSSPERPPRKRHIPPPKERPIMVKEPEAMEEPGAAAEPNGVSTEVRETPVTPKDSDVSPSDKTLAKKKFKISNGIDVGVNNNPSSNSSSRSHMMGNGGENCYDGGFSLAQFLAETLQSQAAEEKQNSPRGETPKEADTPVIIASKEKEREQERVRKEREEQEKAQEEEYESEKRREEALAIEREKEKEKLLSMSHTVANTKHGLEVKHQSKAHKDHDHHHIQVSITSMLHTVKDFLFGKSKKDCHDHVESKVQEFDHSPASTQPPKPDTPPSFRLQLGRNEVCRPLTEDIVPMEIDKPKEPSDSVDTEQHSVSLELHDQKHEDSVPSADLPLAHILPPENIQEPTGQSVKETDGAVEAMEVSAGPESRRAAKEMSLSGLQVLTEDVSVIKEVPIQQQEPHCLVVSPQPSHQPAREKSSPWEDISVLPQTQASYEEQSSPTSTLTSLEESWTPPNSDISAPDSLSLGEASTQTAMNVDKMSKGEPGTEVSHSSIKIFEEEKAEVKSNKQPHSDINRSEITALKAFSLEERIEPCESKTPVQVLLPLSTVAANEKERDNVKEETASVIQEMNVGFPPTATPESLEKGDLKIQPECTSSVGEESTQVHNLSAVQSPNSGFRSSEKRVELKEVLCSTLEKDLEVNLFNDLKTQDTAVLESESTEALNESLQSVVETEKMDLMKVEELDQSKNISVTQDKESNANVSEEGSYVAQQDIGEGRERQQGWPSENIPQIQISTAEDSQYIKPIQNKESNANVSEEGSYVAQRDSIESIESRERRQGWPSENIPQIQISTIDDTPDIKPTQNKEGNANVLKEHTNVAQQDRSESMKRQQGWLSENIPQIQVSSIEDTSDIKPTLPDLNSNEHFETPKVKQMEPGLKECTLPLTILAQNKQEREPAILQKHDATHVSAVIFQDQSMGDSQCLLPTQNGMQNDYNFSPTGKVKEIAKLDDKTEIFDREQPHMKSSEPLSPKDLASIPVINISPTDDKEKDVYVDTLVSDKPQLVETPTVPLFVVPPVSVTCHVSDSALRLSTQSESTETETIAATQRGTKHYVGNNVNTKPQKSQSRKQNLDEMAEKNIQENTPPVLYEAVTPKVGDNGSSLSKTSEIPEILKTKVLKEAKIENSVSVEDLQTNRPYVDRLSSKPPTHPSLSPASLRKFMSRAAPDSDNEAVTTVPVITVGDRQSDKADEDLSGGSTPTSSLSCESSPRLKRRDSLSLIRSATPEELASGARRKIFIPKPKEDGEGVVVGAQDIQGKKETPYMSPSQARRAALLQAPTGQNTPPMERRSPLLSRRKITLEVPKVVEETPTEEPVSTKREEKPAERKPDPLKAPQVIRKIRGEPFPDASGHLKLWCQFFNVLSDSTIKWYKDEEEILELKRSGGDESQVALAIVLASSQDCGVYGCSISNEYGTDTTDFLLSIDILSEILLRDDLEVGEEIEMTPLLFTRGLADTGSWGDKYFGRIMSETVHIGEGCAHKASQVKVIYGLDPIFESGSSGIIKVQNPIAYGTKQETNLAERNLEITKQECKVQNMIREYCKIFAAEARVIENFGQSLEVIPQYLMYRPANSVPYATVEVDLKGAFQMYCMMDPKGKLITRTVSEVEQKCSTFQHWIHQWTHGNLLVTRLEGVETKITNVRVVTKSKGYQGLTEFGSPEVFEQFLTHHQCNYYCGLLGLHPLKTLDSLQQPTKMKGSRSPLLNRKLGSSSPQLQRKGQSPQMFRKANSSPKVTRKVQETEDSKSGTKPKPAETDDVLEMR